MLPACNTEARRLHLDESSIKITPRAHAILILIKPDVRAPGDPDQLFRLIATTGVMGRPLADARIGMASLLSSGPLRHRHFAGATVSGA